VACLERAKRDRCGHHARTIRGSGLPLIRRIAISTGRGSRPRFCLTISCQNCTGAGGQAERVPSSVPVGVSRTQPFGDWATLGVVVLYPSVS